jgi:hypothetical protein
MKKSNRKFIWIGLGLFLIVLIGASIIIFSNNEKKLVIWCFPAEDNPSNYYRCKMVNGLLDSDYMSVEHMNKYNLDYWIDCDKNLFPHASSCLQKYIINGNCINNELTSVLSQSSESVVDIITCKRVA